MIKKRNIPWNKGLTKHTDSRIKKQSETQTGRNFTNEHRENLSKAMKGKIPHNKGKPASEEQKKKQSKKMKGKSSWNKGLTKEKEPRLQKMSKSLSKTRLELFKTGKLKSHRKGVKHTLESNEKNRQNHLGKIHSVESKKNMSIAQNRPETLRKNRERGALQKPKRNTVPEKLTQKLLENTGIDFDKEYGIKEVSCRPDFFIKPNICIFVDGDREHANPKPYIIPSRTSTIQHGFKPNDIIHGICKTRKKPLLAKDVWVKDERITRGLKQKGYKVLRFWHSEIENVPDQCKNKILRKMNHGSDIKAKV